MSSDLTSIAASGIQAAQIALNTVGNNITKQPVPGYNEEKTGVLRRHRLQFSP